VCRASAPISARRGRSFNITGTLTAKNAPLTAKTLFFQRSTDNVHFTTLKSIQTNSTGKCVVSYSESKIGKYYYVFVFSGDSTYATSWSTSVGVAVI
jgi:hypothetical protein